MREGIISLKPFSGVGKLRTPQCALLTPKPHAPTPKLSPAPSEDAVLFQLFQH